MMSNPARGVMWGLCLFLFAGCSTKQVRDWPTADALPLQSQLPDPLVMFDGKPVKTAAQWKNKRKPELKMLFQHYMYGYAPAAPKVHAEVETMRADALGGKATLSQVTLRFGPAGTPPIHLMLLTPNDVKGRVPVFLGVNFCGNHMILDDPQIRLPEVWMYANYPGVVDHRATDAGRGKQAELWQVEKIISRGYGLATFYSGDVDPDKPDFSDGVHPHFMKLGQKQLGQHEWGTIAAWAWGVQRAVDYLVTHPRLDSKRIAVVGHSRLGKTALLAAAFDERIALVIPHQAGCGGTAPNRTQAEKVETVKRINTAFPHWFNDTFPQFNEQVERLPFDQHCLMALVAPRPILVSNAVEDAWANPLGQFQMLQAAEPVYRLLGSAGLAAKQMPGVGELVDSPMGYFIRPGEHSVNAEDWDAFLNFADKNMR